MKKIKIDSKDIRMDYHSDGDGFGAVYVTAILCIAAIVAAVFLLR